MAAKVPGDGKNRQALSAAADSLGKAWAGFKDTVAADDGVKEAFAEVKDKTYEAYDLASEKNHKNQVRAHNEARILTSQEAHEFFDDLVKQVVQMHPRMSAYPAIARDLDPEDDGVVYDMLRYCRDVMAAANKTQTAKGERAET